LQAAKNVNPQGLGHLLSVLSEGQLPQFKEAWEQCADILSNNNNRIRVLIEVVKSGRPVLLVWLLHKKFPVDLNAFFHAYPSRSLGLWGLMRAYNFPLTEFVLWSILERKVEIDDVNHFTRVLEKNGQLLVTYAMRRGYVLAPRMYTRDIFERNITVEVVRGLADSQYGAPYRIWAVRTLIVRFRAMQLLSEFYRAPRLLPYLDVIARHCHLLQSLQSGWVEGAEFIWKRLREIDPSSTVTLPDMVASMMSDNVEALSWAVAQGGRWHESLIVRAFRHGAFKTLEYAISNGCPIPSSSLRRLGCAPVLGIRKEWPWALSFPNLYTPQQGCRLATESNQLTAYVASLVNWEVKPLLPVWITASQTCVLPFLDWWQRETARCEAEHGLRMEREVLRGIVRRAGVLTQDKHIRAQRIADAILAAQGPFLSIVLNTRYLYNKARGFFSLSWNWDS
jgi:hypothetical protein